MLELLLYIIFESIVAVGTIVSPRQESRQRRREELERRRRIRRLTMWWWMKKRRGPLPDWGYICDSCSYPLAGLQDPRCPECGELFVPESALDR
jgi:rubrerythrin